MEGHEREIKPPLLRLLGILSVFCLLILIGFYALGREEPSQTENGVTESAEQKMKNDARYQLKIDEQSTGIPALDAQVQAYIRTMEESFYQQTQGLEPPISNKTFDLIVNARHTIYQDVFFDQITTFSYRGGANYEQEDKNFIYDMQENRFLSILDFLQSENRLEDLSALAREGIAQFFADEGNHTYREELVTAGTEAKPESFQFFSLNKHGMSLIFPPYSVGSRSDGQVEILLPYEKLKGILKDNFLGGTPAPTTELPQQTARDLSAYAGKKLLAFTFDDGPNNATTISLVDGLQKYDARVTFFVLGSRVQAHAKALKHAFEAGNQIGSHTSNHLDLTKLEEAHLRDEIESADAEIESILGVKPTVLRPPYGASNDFVRQRVEKPVILWDVDTLDWKYRDRDRIAEEILSHASDGGIILLHDIYQSSVDGCLQAMETLAQEGYAFVTIEELAQLKSIPLENGKLYFHLGESASEG